MSFSRRAALGSSPTIGSSTTMHSGRWISALVMISFCRIPWLYASISSSFHLSSWKEELIEADSHGTRQKLIITSALIHRVSFLPIQACHETEKLRTGELVVDERPVGDEAQAHL